MGSEMCIRDSLIAGPIVTVLFGHGAFTPQDTVATAAALVAFSIGLPAYVLVKILSTGFFAREDTVTPVRVAVVSMAVNVAASLLLIGPFGHVGVALATAIASWLNTLVLAAILVRRQALSVDPRLRNRLIRIVLASAVMGLVLWFLEPMLAGGLAGTLMERVGALIALIVTGIVVYFATAFGLGAASAADIRAQLRKQSA
mgnify:CR=1 FL=1